MVSVAFRNIVMVIVKNEHASILSSDEVVLFKEELTLIGWPTAYLSRCLLQALRRNQSIVEELIACYLNDASIEVEERAQFTNELIVANQVVLELDLCQGDL